MKPFLYALGAAALSVAMIVGLGISIDHAHRKGPAAVQSPTK